MSNRENDGPCGDYGPVKAEAGQRRQWKGMPESACCGKHPAEGLIFTLSRVDKDPVFGHYKHGDFVQAAAAFVEKYSVVLPPPPSCECCGVEVDRKDNCSPTGPSASPAATA